MDSTAERTRGGKPEGNRFAFNPISLSYIPPPRPNGSAGQGLGGVA